MEPTATPQTPDASPTPALESGTYEVLRQRLQQQRQELQTRLEALNQSRQEVFGSVATTLVATERVTTDHNCVPRDMVSLGHDRFLFGYNVFLGLKTETVITDVFAAYERKGHTFRQVPLDFLAEANFLNEFRTLYRYYRNTIFARFSATGNHLYLVFQVSPNPSDIKAFKWQMEGTKLIYLGNQFDQEVKFPPQHEFVWTRTHRDLHRFGPHPHISIQDRVFVETIGGDLTIKVEDNTQTGGGIYAEPVEVPNQTLDDAEIYYAAVGHLILLKIRPYQEKSFRYFAFNEKLKEVKRIDAMDHACVLLPADHGIIFSNGYYLQLGQFKEFPTDKKSLLFEQRRKAPNGEDYLFIFYRPETGDYVLLSYNVITQRVETPIYCNGYCLFENGELAFFRSDNTPQRHHTIQIWQTPYLDHNVPLPVKSESYLFKIGNHSIVRCLAECQELLTLLAKNDNYAGLFVDIVKTANDIIDTYFWIKDSAAGNLQSVILTVRDTASAAVDEFEKVSRIRQETAQAIETASQKTLTILASLQTSAWQHIDEFVSALAQLRGLRGELSLLKERRYADLARLDQLLQGVAERADQTAQKCLGFLLQPEALGPYQAEIAGQAGQIGSLAKVVDAAAVEDKLSQTAQNLNLLTETVSNLPSSDATLTTQILDSISVVFASLNEVKARLKRRRLELQEIEGAAHFGAQMRLLDQTLASLIETAATPQLCEEFLNRLLAQLQEVEARFADCDPFLEKLAEKREAIGAAFESRKLALVEYRQRKTESLLRTGVRLLKAIGQRLKSQSSLAALESFYVSDPMVHRVQEIIAQMLQLEDAIKASDLQTRLQTLKQEALRQLKDRLELFVDGVSVVQLGKHKFRVQSQELDATIIQRDQQLFYHLTGTDYYQPVEDPDLEQTRAIWSQEVVSEDDTVYRAEYLAYQLFKSLEVEESQMALVAESLPDLRLQRVQQFMSPRLSEGYVKGVHDFDAALILGALLNAHLRLGLLRYPGPVRAAALLFWLEHEPRNPTLAAKLEASRLRHSAFPGQGERAAYIQEIRTALQPWLAQHTYFPPDMAGPAAHYLYDQLATATEAVTSPEAVKLCQEFTEHLLRLGQNDLFKKACLGIKNDPGGAYQVVLDWLRCFVSSKAKSEAADCLEEASIILLRQITPSQVRSTESLAQTDLADLRGSHAVIHGQTYRFDYHQFMEKLRRFTEASVPLFQRFQERKLALARQLRQHLHLASLQSQVLTTFVRNQLIDRVYLPLIGSILAKQIGTAGSDARTDRMGLLLLISPPGYGKTTLMEYIANCLGLVFLKISGPTLGSQITSLDPGESRNAAAREELEKLNLGLEMGDNVMVYLDDIQHCHAEFLQKFISLCDSQRRIEGVWKGRSRTHDFRGKRVAVVMAGNPYTESGARFQIPDMLANRADTYNLGEIIAGSAELFKSSYLENALTSNPTLSKLSRYPKDFQAILNLIQSGQAPSAMEGNYTPEEVADFTRVTRTLLRVREVILRVNEEYIRSAAQAEEHRVEPAFRLQGSYRNMNRLAERVLPIMNEQEIEQLIWDDYQREAQTLASQAESSLLKLKEILGTLTAEETQRWEHIKKTFQRNLLFRSAGSQDPVSRILAQLMTFSEALAGIEKTLAQGFKPPSGSQEAALRIEENQMLTQQMGALKAAIQAISQSLEQRKEPASQIPPTDLPASQIAQGIQNLQATIAACLEQLRQQPTFRLLDPASPADYQVTSVNQQTLGKIWELIDRERGPGAAKHPIDLSSQPPAS